jgi:hypothetical protein
MIPTEWLYGLVGVLIPLLASRLGLPLPGTRGPDLREQVRQSLRELLRGISAPRPAPDDDLRQHLINIIRDSSPDASTKRTD